MEGSRDGALVLIPDQPDQEAPQCPNSARHKRASPSRTAYPVARVYAHNAAPALDCCPGLGREIQQCLGRLQVARHRNMLMRDPPRTLQLPEAYGHVPRGLSGFAGSPRAPGPVETVTKRHLRAYREARVAGLIVNRTLHGGKPCREVLALGVDPMISEWGTMSHVRMSGASYDSSVVRSLTHSACLTAR